MPFIYKRLNHIGQVYVVRFHRMPTVNNYKHNDEDALWDVWMVWAVVSRFWFLWLGNRKQSAEAAETQNDNLWNHLPGCGQ